MCYYSAVNNNFVIYLRVLSHTLIYFNYNSCSLETSLDKMALTFDMFPFPPSIHRPQLPIGGAKVKHPLSCAFDSLLHSCMCVWTWCLISHFAVVCRLPAVSECGAGGPVQIQAARPSSSGGGPAPGGGSSPPQQGAQPSGMAVSRVPSPPPPEVNTPVAENWCYTQVSDLPLPPFPP
jgi:hypothetical protein